MFSNTDVRQHPHNLYKNSAQTATKWQEDGSVKSSKTPESCLEDESDITGESYDSSQFWGNHKEELLDLEYQRWYSDDSKRSRLHQKRDIKVTDLQALAPEGKSTRPDPLSTNFAKPNSDVLRQIVKVVPTTKQTKKTHGYQLPTGIQIEVPFSVQALEKSQNVATNSKLIPNSGPLDSVFNARVTYKREPEKKTENKPDQLKEVTKIADHFRPDLESPSDFEERMYNYIINDGKSRKSDAESESMVDSRPLSYYPNSDLPKLHISVGKPLPAMTTAENSETDQQSNTNKPQLETHLNLTEVPLGNSKPVPAQESVEELQGLQDANSFGNIKIVRFPPTDLCMTDTDNPLESGKLTKELQERGACFRVPTPSGFTLRVPLEAARMLDHGLPEPAVIEPQVTLADVKKLVEEETRNQEISATELINEKTLAALQERPSLVLKQRNYADLLLSRPLHEPKNIGEVVGMQFATGTLDEDILTKKFNYKKIDLNEIVQTEPDTGHENYAQLKRTVHDNSTPPAVPVKNLIKKHDKLGNVHEYMRQYLKDHKMHETAQQLSQEWWLHHDDRCENFPHSTKQYRAARQYFDLAANHDVLLNEYKTTKEEIQKVAAAKNRCKMELRFMVINFKRYAARNAKLTEELNKLKLLLPSDSEAVKIGRKRLQRRYSGMCQLSHNLHKQLKEHRQQIDLMRHQLAVLQGSTTRKHRRTDPKDSEFPDYQGVNPQAIMGRRKPVQMTRPQGMSVSQKATGHAQAITDISMNPFSNSAVTTGADGKWRTWEFSSITKPVSEGAGHNGAIHRCEFHPSGLSFATAGMDNLVNLWSSENFQRTMQLKHVNAVTAISFHSSGDFLLTGCSNGALVLWDLNSQRQRTDFCKWSTPNHKIHKGTIANCQILPYSNIFMSAAEDGELRLWDMRTESNQVVFQESLPIRKAKVASNGQIMGTTVKYDSEIKIWDLRQNGKTVCIGNYSPQLISDFDFESSCHMLALALNNGQVNFWELSSGTTTVYPAHTASTMVATWDIWGENLLSGDEQGNIFLWS